MVGSFARICFKIRSLPVRRLCRNSRKLLVKRSLTFISLLVIPHYGPSGVAPAGPRGRRHHDSGPRAGPASVGGGREGG
eukprot:4163094-Pyramimonas_sp.AAC.1